MRGNTSKLPLPDKSPIPAAASAGLGIAEAEIPPPVPVASAQAADPRVGKALTRLGVAIQRYRIYPARSPLCREAADAAHDALSEWAESTVGDASDTLAVSETAEVRIRVSLGRLYLDLLPLPESGPISELAERLFRADIDELVIRANVTKTELARFCQRLAGWERQDRDLTFSQVLTELDITGIRARDTKRLDVLDYGIVPSSRLGALRSERSQRERQSEGEVDASMHKAWMRVDLDASLEPLDMIDLAFLVDDQMDLARLLSKMARLEATDEGGSWTLRQTVSHLVHLYSKLSPEVAEARFTELAATLMELEREVRQTLTEDMILPDVLETGKSAPLMRLLPDEEIVEALRTLIDLEIGGQGLVRLAFERLDLPGERLRDVLQPLLEDLKSRKGTEDSAPKIEVRLSADGDVFRDMRDFTALELAVDETTAEKLGEIRAELSALDPDTERLRCTLNMIPELRNPDRATAVLEPVPAWLATMMEDDPTEACTLIRSLRDTAHDLEIIDPELTEVVSQVLKELLTPDRIRESVRAWTNDESSSAAMLEAFGPASAEAFLAALDEEPRRNERRVILDFMCAHADLFAEWLVPHAADVRWTVVRNVVLVLGFGGPGREAVVAKALRHPDKRVIREALLALGRIGTPRAAEETLAQLSAEDERRDLAEEAIRRFPPEDGFRLAQRLLSDPDLYLDRPHVTRTLISAFLSDGQDTAEQLLRPLLALRFQFWKPALSRLGWTAAAALRQGRK